MNKISDARYILPLLLCTVICVFTVIVTVHSQYLPYGLLTTSSCMEQVYYGYQNSDNSVSLIPKRDPGITNLSIPDPGIENSIPGLQSL